MTLKYFLVTWWTIQKYLEQTFLPILHKTLNVHNFFVVEGVEKIKISPKRREKDGSFKTMASFLAEFRKLFSMTATSAPTVHCEVGSLTGAGLIFEFAPKPFVFYNFDNFVFFFVFAPFFLCFLHFLLKFSAHVNL